MNLKSGAHLQGGRYRIISTLGRGGFGITYLAEHTMTRRRVCIKEYFPKDYYRRNEDATSIALSSDGFAESMNRYKAKFVKEAQTIATFSHPNIVPIHDAFEENDTAYYVMEYVEGGSLSDIVKGNGALDEATAVDYVRQIASALSYIHERRVMHLDIKPGNIMLRTSDERAMLIDFGLSKHYNDDGEQTSTTPVGISHGYAPFEQYKDGGVSIFSPATDIYSLGATLYYLVTGSVPPSATDIAKGGIDTPTNLSPGVQRAIKEAMNYWREDRPQSIDDFLKLLDDEPEVVAPIDENTIIDVEPKHDDESTIIDVEPTQTPQPKNEPKPKKERKSKRGLWLGIFLFILAAVASFILFGGGSSKKEDAPKSAVATVDTPQLNESPTQEEPKPELILESESEVILPYDGGSGEIKYSVKNDDGVSEVSCANSGDSWLTTTIDIDVIHYSSKKNTTGSERSAIVKVIYGNQSFEVVVTQPAAPVGFTLNSSDSIKLSADGGSAKIKYTITNPVDGESVKYATDAKWLTLKPNDGVVSCTAQANTTGKERSATVTLTYCDQSVKVNISQDSSTPPNNEIWYTSSDGKVVKPYEEGKDIFGVEIESNTYNDGKGIIKFNGNVTTIGKDAFCSRDNLTGVTIPNSVTKIGERAFVYCDSLKEFKSEFASPDGRCLIINRELIAFAPAGITEYTIPDSVTTIGYDAFGYCTNLTSVTIPNSVKTIGEHAFYGCQSLKSVTIPDSVTTIGEQAFSNCINLTSVTIPNSVKTIGKLAFLNCSNLTSITIPNSVTKIGNGAFASCNSLKEFKSEFAPKDDRCLIINGKLVAFAPAGITKFTIPDSVTTIGEYAFDGCSSLTYVTIPNSVTTIGEHAFAWCSNLTSVTIPNSVTTIGEFAFFYCESLKSVTIPNGVTTIGNYTFTNCKSLTSVTIPNSVKTIGEFAFDGCNSLKSVTIPNSVTTIGWRAFAYCRNLTRVTISNSVKTIGEQAFCGCNNLSEESKKGIKSINPNVVF